MLDIFQAVSDVFRFNFMENQDQGFSVLSQSHIPGSVEKPLKKQNMVYNNSKFTENIAEQRNQ